MRAAVIEPSEPVRELVVELLERSDFEVESHAELAPLWHRLHQRDAPRLIVVRWSDDVALDRLCRQVRGASPCPLHFVALCDRASATVALAALASGTVDDLLTSPVEAETVAARAIVARRNLAVLDRVARADSPQAGVVTRDPVTGLWNRASATSLLRRELAAARRSGQSLGVVRLVIAGLELDPASGASEAALRLVAEALRVSVRVSDWITRVGVASFVVLVPGSPEARAITIGERVFRLATERLEGSGVFASVRVEVDAFAVRAADVDPHELEARALGE